MNAPDPLDHIEVPAGTRKVTMTLDDKLQNAATFTLSREDHTLGDLIRMHLLTKSDVTFAGYQVPHPLVKDVLVKVQTKPPVPPGEAVIDATDDIKATLSKLAEQFDSLVAEAHERERDEFG